MNQDPARVSQIHWMQVFPLLRLFRAASLGCSLPPFLLAYACLLASWTGCSVANHFLSDGSITAVCEFPWHTYAHLQGKADRGISVRDLVATTQVLPAPLSNLETSTSYLLFGSSLSSLFGRNPGRQSVPWLLSLDLIIWNALVLGLFGTAVARSVATSFCNQSRSGVFLSLRYSGRHLRATLLATGLIVAFLAILHLMLRCAELIMQFGSIGEAAIHIVWGPIFLTATALVIVFIVGGTAWLLSLSATGTDGCSGADALSRCISYILSHGLWSAGGIMVVTVTALTVRWLVQLILIGGHLALPEQLQAGDFGVVHRIWMFIVELTPDVIHLSVFLSGLTVLYVLLRQREDGIHLGEIDGAV